MKKDITAILLLMPLIAIGIVAGIIVSGLDVGFCYGKSAIMKLAIRVGTKDKK